MLSGTPTGHFVSTPAWNRTRTKTLGGLVLSITPPGHKSRRLDLHQHHPVYKTGASLFGHVGISTGVRNRTPPGGFGSHLLAQEHTRVGLPASKPGAVVVAYVSSSTFQYASLTNFDQLSIRTSRSA